MTREQPDGPVDYPDAWRRPWMPEPAPAPEPEIQPSIQMDLAAAAMTDAEFEAFVKRTRGGRV